MTCILYLFTPTKYLYAAVNLKRQFLAPQNVVMYVVGYRNDKSYKFSPQKPIRPSSCIFQVNWMKYSLCPQVISMTTKLFGLNCHLSKKKHLSFNSVIKIVQLSLMKISLKLHYSDPT